MTPTETDSWRKYMEQRHSDLRNDYCGADGISGFKGKVENAMDKLREKDAIDRGFREGVNATLDRQNRLLKVIIAIAGLAVSLLIYFGSRDHQHQGLFSLTHSQTIGATDSGIRDTSR